MLHSFTDNTVGCYWFGHAVNRREVMNDLLAMPSIVSPHNLDMIRFILI